MNRTIDILEAHSVESIRLLNQTFDTRSARRLLEVHLDDANFAMPIHSLEAEEALLKFCHDHRPVSEAAELLDFESTRTLLGIVRVLARTHINGQGVGRVRRGARWPTQSRRVLGLFERIEGPDDLCQWLDHRRLADDWLRLANDSRGPHVPKEQRFDDDDIAALKTLRELTSAEACDRRLPLREKFGPIGENWARVALGLHTGVLYLHQRFQFDPLRVWATVNSAVDAASVKRISDDASRFVTHFGPALAPSFFADLGSVQFVKPDVHVVDSVTAALNLPHGASSALAIDIVRNVAKQAGCTPRRVDKLMYFACSGKFYLAGLELDKRSAKARKEKLVAALRGIPDVQRPRIV